VTPSAHHQANPSVVDDTNVVFTRTERRLREKVVIPLLSLFLTTFAILTLLELALRFLPVTDYTYPEEVNEKNPVAKVRPGREVVFSNGWDFRYRNRVKVNNDGFINDQDYDAESKQPLMAVVGDSYIEALIVPYPSTVYGVLAGAYRGRLRVYSFGFSGAPLSQYLVWARYARQKYGNGFLVINVVGNDFDESLMKYKNQPGNYYYNPNANGELVLKRIDYVFTKYRFVFRSTLLRYVLLNLQAANAINNVRSLFSGNANYVGNVDFDATQEKVDDSKRAIAAFFRDLPEYSGLPKSRVLLVIDAMRPSLYSQAGLETARNSYYDQMRREFMAVAAAQGYSVIDMQHTFLQHYDKNHQQFEFPHDGHWNGLGRRLVAEDIMQSELFQRFLWDAVP
jgi:hypothetical protein